MTTQHQYSDTPQQARVVLRNKRLIRTVIIGSDRQHIAANPRLEVQNHDCLRSLLEETSFEAEPELIIISQSFSDQFSPAEIDQLFQKYPLSLCLCVYGPLCESDGRTRNLWPQSIRVSHWNIHQRIEREIEVLSGISPALPITATREEVFHFEFQALSKSPVSQSAQAIVFSPDATWTELVAEAWESCRQSKCKRIHRLEDLENLLSEAGNSFDGQVILDVDSPGQAIKQWLQKRQKNSSNRPTPEKSALSQSHHDDILKFSATPDDSAPNYHILAASNWVTLHCKEELKSLGVNQYVCKMNLLEILCSPQNIFNSGNS